MAAKWISFFNEFVFVSLSGSACANVCVLRTVRTLRSDRKKLRLPIRSTRVYTQTGFLRIYARIYTNFTYKMCMRIYAILGNVRIAYIFFQFFAYGQTQERSAVCFRNRSRFSLKSRVSPASGCAGKIRVFKKELFDIQINRSCQRSWRRN